MIELQERDLRLMGLGYEQRILRSDQIERYVFKGAAHRTVRRRLRLLESSGLIRRLDLVQTCGRRVVRLTREGINVVESGRAHKIQQGRKLDVETLIHDAGVTTVRLRLEELWDGKWTPEALLKSEEFPQIPDGLWTFPNGNRVAVEVENSPKGDKRFHVIQERWRATEIRLVLYVATGETMERIVRRYLESGPKDLPFGLVRLDLLEAGEPPVWTVLRDLPLLNRRSF